MPTRTTRSDPACALVVEFASGSRVRREAGRDSALPILQNGPPGTYVYFLDGTSVPLPTDQIVFAEDEDGQARVGFGGMRYTGVEAGQLVFHRTRDLVPAGELSPERGLRMTLELEMVMAVLWEGAVVWRAELSLH